MAIEKLFLCLTTLVILAAIPASCAPQLWNFGWPSQQESIPRLPARAFMPAEAGPNSRPLSFMPISPLSPSVPMPTVAASPQRQVPVAQQPRKLEKQETVPESRLFIGPTKPVSITKLNEVVVTTTANPVPVVTTTELSQPIGAVKTASTTAVPGVVVTTIPPPTAANAVTELFSEHGEQNLMDFIPAGVAALGAVLGRDGCYMKAACLAGRLVPASLRGQGMMLLAAESMVPAQWKGVFRAAKSSMIDRKSQDCSSFTCF